MIKNLILRLFVSIPLLFTVVNAQDGVDAIEKARQAKEAADKAAAEAAAATEAAIEAAAAKAAKAARADAKKKKEEDEARKAAEALAAEEAELDAAASAAAEEAKRKMAEELGLEVADSKDTPDDGATDVAASEVAEDVIAQENFGWNIGFTGSVGFINGEYITNTPTGGSIVINTPMGFKLGKADFNVSLAFGSYNGEGDNEPLESILYGIGGNLTLFDFLFYEGHVGQVGAGMGGRGFGGVTLEKLMSKGLNLPFNLLIGAEGFLTTKADERLGNSTYWGGLGVRLDFSF